MKKTVRVMMKPLIGALLAASVLTSMLSGCASAGVTPQTGSEGKSENLQTVAAPETTADAAASITPGASDYATGTPWIYSCVDGVIDASTPTNLKDDFYLAANKNAILGMQYQPGRSMESNIGRAMYEVQDKKITLVQDQTPDSHEGQLVHDYYMALDDWDTRTALAQVRYQERMEKINSLTDMKDYCSHLYNWNEDNALNGLFDFGLAYSTQDSSIWIAGLYNGSLILGDSAEYSQRTDDGEMRYEMYKDIYKYALELVGEDVSRSEENFDRLIAFETKFAEHTMTVAEANRAEAVALMDNYLSIDAIDALLGENFNFRYYLESNDFVPKSDIQVSEPELLAFYGEILNDDANLEDIKNREAVRYLINFASEYSKESLRHVQEIAAGYTGVAEIEEYEKTLLDSVSSMLNIPLQIAYVNAYSSPEMKAQIDSLCREIADEYCEILENVDWIGEKTRSEAIHKLQSIQINSLYPERWEDYSGLDISGMNLYEADAEIKRFEVEKGRERLNTKIDQEIWTLDCTETNAYYMQSNNSIYILLGFLGDKTFTPDMSRAEILGRIGFVIGHELSHAFDSAGGQFNAAGNMVDWWTAEDKQQFEERVQKVRSRFDGICIYGDNYLVGSMLDGEATADITATECMLNIAKKDANFDYDTFFRAAADLWACRMLPYAADYLYVYDTHAPNYLRTNVTFQQFDEFLETYDIHEGDGMFLAPKDRIVVW